MLLCFLFVGYSAVATDSIQTRKAFKVGNSKRHGFVLLAIKAIIFIAVASFSYWYFDGDVTYNRIYNPEKYPDLPQHSTYVQPEAFSFIQLAAPLILLAFTGLLVSMILTVSEDPGLWNKYQSIWLGLNLNTI